MRNKELKVGDKVWINSAYMAISSGYTVKSVKKSKTLVTVVAEGNPRNGEPYELIMYGHYNSRILSGYNRKFGRDDICYTCDYSLIQKNSDDVDYQRKQLNAGHALLELAKYFKE